MRFDDRYRYSSLKVATAMSKHNRVGRWKQTSKLCIYKLIRASELKSVEGSSSQFVINKLVTSPAREYIIKLGT